MPKAAKNADEEKKPVMDVDKPGKKPADATSRPLIVSRKVIVKDDTVKEADDDAVPGAPDLNQKDQRLKKLMGKKSTEINISPEGDLKKEENAPEEPKKNDSTDDKPKDEDKPEKEEEKKPAEDEPKADGGDNEKEEEKADKEPDGPKKEDDKEEPDDNESEEKSKVDKTDPIVDELAKQALGKRQKEEQEKQQKAQEEKIQKLSESKKYFLPVGQVTRRRNNRRMLMVLILIIVLAIVVLNFLIDADIIQVGVKPLTNLF